MIFSITPKIDSGFRGYALEHDAEKCERFSDDIML
ncbi:hypothetical protein CUJ84_pRLN2000486 (plasmid) [Rhizobium leguminosarum]|uniref:Uncharacterized protein n=1 Tax=Rhizobium leguminosarum TaxID=384 RepID=A0A2K9ZFK5_RHILE|nr:hypothetical protein CUJ84_pRLN2000486 [Rhizobium leguminosarum]